MFPVCRSPSDHTCLLVSTPNKALSQSFENLLDDNNFGLVHVRSLTISHCQLLGSNIWIRMHKHARTRAHTGVVVD